MALNRKIREEVPHSVLDLLRDTRQTAPSNQTNAGGNTSPASANQWKHIGNGNTASAQDPLMRLFRTPEQREQEMLNKMGMNVTPQQARDNLRKTYGTGMNQPVDWDSLPNSTRAYLNYYDPAHRNFNVTSSDGFNPLSRQPHVDRDAEGNPIIAPGTMSGRLQQQQMAARDQRLVDNLLSGKYDNAFPRTPLDDERKAAGSALQREWMRTPQAAALQRRMVMNGGANMTPEQQAQMVSDWAQPMLEARTQKLAGNQLASDAERNSYWNELQEKEIEQIQRTGSGSRQGRAVSSLEELIAPYFNEEQFGEENKELEQYNEQVVQDRRYQDALQKLIATGIPQEQAAEMARQMVGSTPRQDTTIGSSMKADAVRKATGTVLSDARGRNMRGSIYDDLAEIGNMVRKGERYPAAQYFGAMRDGVEKRISQMEEVKKLYPELAKEADEAISYLEQELKAIEDSTFILNKDFSEKSQYHEPEDQIDTVSFATSKYDDGTYDPRYSERDIVNGRYYHGTVVAWQDNRYDLYTTQTEKDMYNYIAETQGDEAAHNWLMERMPTIEYRRSNAWQEQWTQQSKEHPIAAAAFSSVAKPFASASGIIGEITGASPYSNWFMLNSASETTNAAVRNMIDQATQGNANLFMTTVGSIFGETGQKAVNLAARFGYDAIKNAADMAVETTFGNALGAAAGVEVGSRAAHAMSLIPMAMNVSQSSYANYKENNVDTNTARTLATLAAAAEFGTELLGMEWVFSRVRSKGGNPSTMVLRALACSGAAEALEEVPNEIAVTLAENMLLGEESEMNQQIDERVHQYTTKGDANGKVYSEEEARKQATLEVITQKAWDVSYSMMVAGVSGAAHGAYQAAYDFNAGTTKYNAKVDEAVGMGYITETQAQDLKAAHQNGMQAMYANNMELLDTELQDRAREADNVWTQKVVIDEVNKTPTAQTITNAVKEGAARDFTQMNMIFQDAANQEDETAALREEARQRELELQQLRQQDMDRQRAAADAAAAQQQQQQEVNAANAEATRNAEAEAGAEAQRAEQARVNAENQARREEETRMYNAAQKLANQLQSARDELAKLEKQLDDAMHSHQIGENMTTGREGRVIIGYNGPTADVLNGRIAGLNHTIGVLDQQQREAVQRWRELHEQNEAAEQFNRSQAAANEIRETREENPVKPAQEAPEAKPQQPSKFQGVRGLEGLARFKNRQEARDKLDAEIEKSDAEMEKLRYNRKNREHDLRQAKRRKNQEMIDLQQKAIEMIDTEIETERQHGLNLRNMLSQVSKAPNEAFNGTETTEAAPTLQVEEQAPQAEAPAAQQAEVTEADETAEAISEEQAQETPEETLARKEQEYKALMKRIEDTEARRAVEAEGGKTLPARRPKPRITQDEYTDYKLYQKGLKYLTPEQAAELGEKSKEMDYFLERTVFGAPVKIKGEGADVMIDGFAKSGADAIVNVKVTDENGKTTTEQVPLADIDFEGRIGVEDSYLHAAAYEDVDAARNYLAGAQVTQADIYNYARGFEGLYAQALTGTPMTDLQKASASMIEPHIQDIIKKAGERARTQMAENLGIGEYENANMTAREAEMPVKEAMSSRRTGVVRDYKRKLNGSQQMYVTYLDNLMKHAGMQAIVTDRMGEYVKGSNSISTAGINGVFREGTNRIIVNLDAMKGAVAITAMHEAWHFVKQEATHDKQLASHVEQLENELERILTNTKGFDMAKRIKEVQALYKNAVGKELSEPAAREEIFADALRMVALNRNTKGELYKSVEDVIDPSIAERIVSTFKKWARHIKQALNDLKNESPEIRAMAQQANEDLDRLALIFQAMRERAGQVYAGRTGETEAEEGDVKYSLVPVEPIMPSSGAWSPDVYADFESLNAAFPNLYNIKDDRTEEQKKNDTSIAGTVGTYRKIYEKLKGEGFDGTILDASSGMGLGTKAGREEFGFKVDDIEPFPAPDYTPSEGTDYSKLNKKYDVIISNAVLNVETQDQRDANVVKLGQLLKNGGRMFINVRGVGDVANLRKNVDTDWIRKNGMPSAENPYTGKKNIQIGENEYYTGKGTYQKGFTEAELKAYLEDALGPGYTVEIDRRHETSGSSAAGAIVTKDVTKGSLHPNSELYSISQLAESWGLTCKTNEAGDAYEILGKDGKPIRKVTSEMVDKTPVGVLINGALTNKTINENQAKQLREFAAGMMNLSIRHKDQAMVWEIASQFAFSALKGNSDVQYGDTIDFGTICAKTQAIIDVMSETMLEKGRGLTREEIIAVYNRTHQADLSVPCPVCYVFSRWLGVPSLLDNMRRYQERFDTATDEDINDYVRRVEEKYYDPTKKNKNGDPISVASQINSQKTKLQNKLDSLGKRMLKANDEGDTILLSQLAKQERELSKEYEDLECYNWVMQVLCKTNRSYKPIRSSNGRVTRDPKYKPVDLDILLDLRRTGEFARDYAKSWRYRTTRGAGMGKAIMPYSGMSIGDIIYGTNRQKASKNALLRMNQDGTNKAIGKKMIDVLRQNLIGGQRLQSTSDFRPEWGLDYLMAFMELQAVGAKGQMYTKVIEAVDLFATAGIEVNLSIMPKDNGYSYDENGEPILRPENFSSVTGIDYEAALEKVKTYDNVQMILVGISDNHIRAALKNKDIAFVIPWHSSGSNAHILGQLMGAVGEHLENGTDYSDTQTDKIDEKNPVWQMRMELLTGKLLDGLTSEQRQMINQNKYLKDLYRRFYLDESEKETYHVWLKKDQAGQIFPYEYWDTSLTVKDAKKNGERFKEYCRSMGVIPRFSGYEKDGKTVGDFTGEDGYWKLLIDRCMYNNDGTYHKVKTIDATKIKISDVPMSARSARYGDREKTSRAVQNSLNDIQAMERKAADLRVVDAETESVKYSLADVEEAAEKAFPNSKVRDADGKLLKMYHGTGAEFTEFKRDRIGSTGRFEGSGFNFTPYEGRASSYGKNVLAGYLNIEKPLSAEKKTISLAKLAKIIREADPTGDNIIADYARETRDYGKPSFVQRESMTAARNIWESSDNDVDIYSFISSADSDAEGLIAKFEELGYDGLIHYDDNGNIKTAVAFSSHQFKLADEVTRDDNGKEIPLSERFNTKSEDIRYSLADRQYRDAVKNGDTALADQMVERAARRAGYTLKVTHRTNAEFNVFDKTKRSGKNGKSLGDGFYVAELKDGRRSEYDSDAYGKNRIVAYVDPGNVFNLAKGLSEEQAEYVYDKYFAPFHEDRFGTYKPHVIDKLQSSTRLMDYIIEAAETNDTTTDEIFKDLGYDSIKDGPQYAIFDSNQIKRADTATYDDDGELIPLSERFNPEKEDIRYSLSDPAVEEAADGIRWSFGTELTDEDGNSEMAQLLNENERLQAENQRLRNGVETARALNENRQMRELMQQVTTQINQWRNQDGPDAKQIARMARDVREALETTVPYEDLKQDLTSVFQSMSKAKTPTESKAAMQALSDLMLHCAYNSRHADKSDYEQYADERATIKSVSPRAWKEICADVGMEWNYFRRTWGPKLGWIKNRRTMTEDGASIDSAWQELNEMNPGTFSDDTLALGDKAAAMLAFMDNTAIHYYNPHTEENPMNRGVDTATYAASDMAMKLLYDYMTNGHEVKGSDQQRMARITELMDQTMTAIRENRGRSEGTAPASWQKKMDEMKRRIREERSAGYQRARDARADERARQQDIRMRQAERRAEMEDRRKTIGEINRKRASLLKKLEHPSSSGWVPTAMRDSVTKLLTALDFENEITGEQAFTEDLLKEAKAAYESINKGEGPDGARGPMASYYNGDLVNTFDKLIETAAGKKASQLTDEEMSEIRDIVSGFAAAVINADTMFTTARSESVHDMGDTMIEQSNERRNRLGEHRVQGKLGQWLSTALSRGLLKPTTVYGEYEGTVIGDIYKRLRAAEFQHIRNVTEAEEFFQDLINKYHMQSVVNQESSEGRSRHLDRIRRHSKSFRLSSGQTVNLTTQELMTLYAWQKREGMMETNHLLGGGFTLRNQAKGGSTAEYRVNSGDLAQFNAALTEDQKKFVDEMVKYLSTTVGGWGNEVTEILYGLSKFTESYYLPFTVNKNYVGQDPAQAQDARIKVASFTKDLTRNASTTLELAPFMTLWASHVEQMSDFNAFTLPIEDMVRVMNYRQSLYDDEGKFAGYGESVRPRMQQAWGRNSTDYIYSFLARLNGNSRQEHGGSWINRFMGTAKGAAVTFNLSVAAQQMGAGIRAMAEMNPIDVAKGIAKGLNVVRVNKQYEELMQYAPIAIEKSWGYFDTNMKSGLYDRQRKTAWNWVEDKGGKLAEFGDMFNWVQIWQACKSEAQRQNKGADAETIKQKAGERFAEVIDRTQVVDSVFQRAEWATEKGMMKNLMAFMSEPITMYNMLYRSATDFGRAIKTKQGAAKAFGKLTRNVAAIGMSGALTALLKSLITGLRNRDDEKKDEEGNIIGRKTYWDKVQESWGGNMIDNLLGVGTVFSSAIQDVAGTYRSSNSLTDAWIGNLYDAGKELIKGLDGTSEPNYEKAFYKALQGVSSLCGVGFASLYRDSKALIDTAKEEFTDMMVAADAYDDSKSLEERLSVATQTMAYTEDHKGPGMKKKPGFYTDLLLDVYMKHGLGAEFEQVADAAISVGATAKGLQTSFRNKLSAAEDRVPAAAKAMADGDTETYNRLVHELLEYGIGSKIINSMIESEYKKLVNTEEEPKEPGTGEDLIGKLKEGDEGTSLLTTRADNLLDNLSTRDQVKEAVSLYKQDGLSEDKIAGKLSGKYKNSYIAACINGDTAEQKRLQQILTVQGGGITAADLKKWTTEDLFDSSSKAGLYYHILNGDTDAAKKTAQWLYRNVEGGQQTVKDKVTKWAKNRTSRGTATDWQTVRAVLKAMGFSQDTIDKCCGK